MRIVVGAARMLGADELLDVSGAHIDGCLYHGDSGTLFAERLSGWGATVQVPTSLNVGALDMLHPNRERLAAQPRDMAKRMSAAYLAMGCKPTWTCAPYQAGYRPRLGQDVAWGESNAVVFCNSVLGARTNRYGDFIDICAAITGRAPRTGLHLPRNRRATVLVDLSSLPRAFLDDDIAYPILGAWLGANVGDSIAAFAGWSNATGHWSDDRLKALGAAAASSGSVGLFHVIGVTPEAVTLDAAFQGEAPQRAVLLTISMLTEARNALSSVAIKDGEPIDAVAVGSPHLSADELRQLDGALKNNSCRVPIYACTSRHSLSILGTEGIESRLRARGVIIVTDTCIVVTPILPQGGRVLVTNSGKFAHYTPANTGYGVVFASLTECVQSAIAGCLKRNHREPF
jgi:predicted aconitase